MWKQKGIIWMFGFLLVLSTVFAVNNGTSVNLRSVCTTQYGNICTDTGLWTVIKPTGVTLVNNTAGSATSYGVQNYSFLLDTLGTYYVYVNYSSQNVSKEWNVISEDYKTREITSTNGGINMLGTSLFIAFIIGVLIWTSFKLDKEHTPLKVFLLLISFFIMVLGTFMLRQDILGSSITSYLDTLTIILVTIVVLITCYVVIYFIYISLMNAKENVDKLEKNE